MRVRVIRHLESRQFGQGVGPHAYQDKDDLESPGLLKVDVLTLGIMSAMRKALD